MVFNLALNYLQNVEDAEEVTQDVFFSIYKNIGSFKHNSKLSTWIYRITINKCLDCIKAKNRAKRFGKMLAILPFSNQADQKVFVEHYHPGLALENKEAVYKLFKYINSLPTKQKTALLLHKVEALSQQEIASIMNISTKAVGALIVRAKENIKIKIENEIDKY